MGWPTGQGPNRPRSRASGANPPAEDPYEQEFEDEAPIIYVRQEARGLLWRSIVQGFGFAIGFFLAGVVFWLMTALLLALLFHQGAPRIPGL